MPNSDAPDRRPLLYGLAGLLILVAAFFIFWPKGDKPEQPSFTLTPPSVGDTTSASSQTVPVEGENELTQSTSADPSATEAATPPATETTAKTTPATETKSATKTPSAVPTKTASTTSSTPQQADQTVALNQKEFAQEELPEPEDAKPKTQNKASSSTPAGNSGSTGSTARTSTRASALAPGPNGSYQLWVGSFGQHDYAQRHAQTLSQQGIEGTVVEAKLPDGRTVYRVRVGFFQSRDDATAYGDRMKLDYWVARR